MKAGLRYFADKDPAPVALVSPGGDEWSRGELDSFVNRTARAYLKAGLVAGDALIIAAPNCAEFVGAYLAGLQAGLSVVPVNWHLADAEIAFLIEDSQAAGIVAHASLGPRKLGRLREAARPGALLAAIGHAPGFAGLRELGRACPDTALAAEPTGRLMAYTSATTGRPKAVRLPARSLSSMLEHIVRTNESFGIRLEDDNVHLCASMLYHSAPLGGVEVALHMGHRVVLSGRWEPEMLLRLIDRHRVTTTFMVPTMFVRLLKLPREVRERYSTASLRFVAHGAAPCPARIKRRMIDWWGEVIWESYGTTEAQGTIASAAEWLAYPGTVGRPLPGSRVKILDERGRELPPGEVGLIYLVPHTGDRFEYKGAPEKTRHCYDGDFVTVGDLGYLNDDGYLFLCDRSANLIISSGVNIYPAEIETLLVEHAAVRDCAVVGEPHELLGTVPKAFVQTEPGTVAGPALTAELLAFLAPRLGALKLPRRIEYVAEVPRDPNGKLFKRKLAAPGAARPGSIACRRHCHT